MSIAASSRLFRSLAAPLAAGLLVVAALLALFTFPSPARADDMDTLLRILVRKGVLTEEEAKEIREEAKKEAAAEKAAAEKAAAEAAKAAPPAPAAPAPPAPAPEAKPGIPFSYEMGKGTSIGTPGEHSLNFQARTQVRFDSADGGAATSFFATSRDKDKDGFALRRLQLRLFGDAFPQFEYEVQLNPVKSAMIEDMRLAWSPKGKRYRINVGQYKVPFLREQVTSDGGLSIVDRSIVDSIAPARDIGVMMDGRVPKADLTWAVGIFNGAGEGKLNDDGKFLYAGRMEYAPLGEYTKGQSDFARSKKALFAVAANLAFSHDSTESFPRTIAGKKDMWGVDVAWRWKGFDLEGEYVSARYNPDDPAVGPFDAEGLRLQGSAMVWKKLEVTGRWAEFTTDENPYYSETRAGTKVLLDSVDVATLATAWYFSGHPHKVTADYNWVSEDYYTPGVDNLDDNVFRVQYQIWF